jgi:hypothetical protein
MSNELPPLPKPQDYGRGLYTADQMRAYAQAALDALAETDRPSYDAPVSKHATLAEWWAEKQAAEQSLCPHEHAINDWRLHNSGIADLRDAKWLDPQCAGPWCVPVSTVQGPGRGAHHRGQQFITVQK